MGQGPADSQPGLPFHRLLLGFKPTPLVPALQKGLGSANYTSQAPLRPPANGRRRWECSLKRGEELLSGFQLRAAASSSLQPLPPLRLPAGFPSVVPVATGLCVLGV